MVPTPLALDPHISPSLYTPRLGHKTRATSERRASLDCSPLRFSGSERFIKGKNQAKLFGLEIS
jgi:hypothetical protein